MESIELAGRRVGRLGLSVAALRVTGMWGEPAGRTAAVAAIRRAVELGAGVVEVTVPFGAGADLLREAAVPDAAVIARLTGRVAGLDAVRRRLGGRPPLLVLVDEHRLGELEGWPVAVGVVVGAGSRPSWAGRPAAVRGPWPAPRRVFEWCGREEVPYLAPATAVLGAGALTVAVLSPRSISEVERVFGSGAVERPVIPPAAGPG